VTSNPATLPAHAIVLHIGPHKTGTTTVQRSLFAARKGLERSGVLFPAKRAHPRVAFKAATGAAGLRGERPGDIEVWNQLVARSRKATDRRVILSSEMCADAAPDRIQAMVDDLGIDRLQIVVTLRALTKILPSQWQEHVQNRVTMTYPEFLDEIFNQPESRRAGGFWRRHAHEQLIDRWAAVVGPERVTAVVGDDADPRLTLSAFETLLGLPSGTLELGDNTNRSLTLAEAELVRLINLAAKDQGWSDERYRAVIRRGMVNALTARPADPADPRLTTPEWAVDAALQRQAAAVKAIAASGVNVYGDLDRLLTRPQPTTTVADPLEAAAQLIARFAGATPTD
jgi:hypothetical protein